jgi:Flp pilus assembly protein TadD
VELSATLVRKWVPRAVALVAFATYALAAPAGLFWLDSGELSAAAYQLGSPHPTGFPLFAVGAKAMATLVPFGEIAFRINLFSAVCAALAVFFVARLVVEASKEDVAAICGSAAAGLVLAFGFVFFRQATVAEVYAPNAALMAAALYLLFRVTRDGEARDGLLLAMVIGLGAAAHITFLLVTPVAAVYLIFRLRRGARWPLLAPLLALTVAFGMYTYLPVRSATDKTPTVDWGHPRTAGQLIDHVSAGRPRRAFSGRPAVNSSSGMRSTTPAVIAHNAGTFFGDASDHMGPVALLAMLGGLIWLCARRRSRWIGVALALVVAGDAFYSIWLNPMGLIDLQNGVPFAVAASIAAGVGLAWFARSMGRAAPFAGAVGAVILVVPALLGSAQLGWSASSGDLPRAWAQASLDSAPPRGVALVQNDSTAAGLIYLTTVEGARPDVAVLVRQHLVRDAERTRRVLARSNFELPPGKAALPALLASGRPLLWEVGRDRRPRGRVLQPGIPLARLYPRGREPAGAADDFTAALDAIRPLIAEDSARDRSARRVLAVALNTLGRLAYGRGRSADAAVLFDAAIHVRPNHQSALINRGTVAADQRDFESAALYTERALEIDPNHVKARINAARWRLRLDDDAIAERHLRRAIEVDDQQASAWALLALIDLRSGAFERAYKHLHRAYGIDPRNADVNDIRRQLERPAKAPE